MPVILPLYSYLQARQAEPGQQPFATDPKYRTRQAATASYIGHIRAMGWPEELTEVLEQEATFAPADDAQEVYLHMLREGPVVLSDMQYAPEDARNWGKVQDWLREAAEASGATAQALSEASAASVAAGTVAASAQDARDLGVWAGEVIKTAAEGAKTAAEATARNPWPYVIGAGLVLYGLRRAKII